MASVLIVVGSVYGNSSSVAEECAELLRSAGHEAEILSNASLNDLIVRPESVFIGVYIDDRTR
ncbi:MAG: hypothetical protein LRY63_06895 [Nitrincola sp.]|nr:hypothetical protein [Nitrincola sp.]